MDGFMVCQAVCNCLHGGLIWFYMVVELVKDL